MNTLKPAISGHSKIDKTKVLKTDVSLKQVESNAECPKGCILQNFRPAVNDILS